MSAALAVTEPEDLTQLRELYHAGRFVDALRILEQYSPPEMWRGCEARILAGRLFENLGADRRGANLLRQTWKAYPQDPDAVYYQALGVAGRHGPFEALQFTEPQLPSDAQISAGGLSKPAVHLCALAARLLAQFHDFDASEKWLNLALQTRGDDPWVKVEESIVRQLQDRLHDAYEASRAALLLRPGYRPALGMMAHLLSQLNRDDEAIDVLKDAVQRMQSGSIAQQLANLLIEQKRFAEAAEALNKAREFYPMAERPTREWLEARTADVLYRCGELEPAITAARKVTGRYYETVAARLEQARQGKTGGGRVVHPVVFVRQHHMTCAPATISALSVFWKRPIDHLALAKVITYDGTPDHEERYWLENNGWYVREFRVTWDAARALIDRGVPFTLVTTWIRSAHLQAVIGYDGVLGTLVIRDPSYRSQTEALAAELLEQQAPFGPRGMVLLPPEERGRVDGIDLPEFELYDHWFELRRALVRHDRAAAETRAEAIDNAAKGHRLAWQARRELAYYDDNPQRAYEAVAALRAMFPDEGNLKLEELSLLARLGRGPERMQRLRDFAHSRGADPVFWREYAEQLRVDAREHPRALKYARRLMRVRPIDWSNLAAYGHLLWDGGDFAQALRVYRLAASVGDKVEAPWNIYFSAARLSGRTDEALALLRKRWRNLAGASSFPTHTLCAALNQMALTQEAHRVLDDALKLRPDDGELLLLAADEFARIGNFERAADWLARAKPRTSRASWLASAAKIASWRAEHAVALEHCREMLAMNPLQESALRETARLLAVLGGKEAAETWLAEQVTRFPHHLPLRQLRLEWLRSHPAELALAEVEQYLAVEPRDAWALREKALILLRARRPEDALAPAQLAETIDPRTPGSAGIVGQVLLALRRFEEAQRATERALRHSIDADWLFSQLLATCRSFEEKKAAVQFLAQELRTQASLGSGFLTFVDVATGVLAPDELANLLESLRGDQARHWQVWAACIQQMLATAKLDAALSLAEEATQRFPLLPRLWVELAEVHQARGNLELEINALERARDMSPAWCLPRIRLAGAYLRAGRVRDVGTTLQEGLRHDPMDPQLTLEHARYLWQASQPEEALQAIEKAISLAPSYSFAWALLQQWSREMRKPERVIETARRLVRDRAGDPDPLWRLAQELGGAKKFNEALSCVDRAIALDSTHVQSHDYRAVVLCDLGRYEDALASCRPAEFGKDIPRELRAREAWVYWLAGNPTQAVTLIRSVLETHPDFSWGWQLLADWLEAQGKMKEAADAAERLAALNPGSAFPLGYIGDLRLKAGEKAKAADAFRRALRIDPGYLFGAFSLLQIACEESAWAEVESVMLLVRHHASRWHALRAEVLVFRWKKDREAADAAMRELLKAPTHETNALLGAAGFYHDAGWAARLVSVIERAWSDPEINDEAGAIWVNACRAAGKSAPVGKLMKSSAKHGVKHAALSVHVEQLAGEDARIRMTLLLWKHRDFLRKSTRTWASIGYVLAQFRKHARLIDWMRDWEHRPDLEAWMLYYLTAAYFERGSDAQAEQIVRRALLLPADRCRPIFVAWSAYYSALRGEYAAAAKTLEMFDAPEDFLASKALAEISRQLISVGKASAEERVRAFAAARRSMGRLKADNPAAYDVGYVKRAHQIALRKMATQADAAFWRLWYRLPPLG